MPVRISVCPRLTALAALVAIVTLASPLHSQDGVTQPAPARIKTASALPAVVQSSAPLPDSGAAARLRIDPQAQSATPAFIPGRVIVKFREEAPEAMRTLTASSVGGTRMTKPAHANFDLVQIGATADAEAVAATLAAQANVEYAQPDYRLYPRMQPNDPAYRYQWNFPLIGLESGWDVSPGASPSIIVAILDTGMAYQNASFNFTARAFRLGPYTYPALGTVTIPFALAPDLISDGRIVSPRDLIWNDNDPVDLDGHGTHVAGTIGELTNNNSGAAGIAYNVKLMPVKVIASDWDQIFGAPNSGTDSTLAEGIRYAVDNGARVLNMSLGRTGSTSPVIEDALRYAVGKGAVVTIAAGNEYNDGNPDEVPAIFGPRIAGVITVGAVGPDLNRANYSSVKSYIEVAAPGGDYKSAGSNGLVYQQTYHPDYIVHPLSDDSMTPSRYAAPRFDVMAIAGYQGTSMAAPHVAGLAALLMHHGITDPSSIEARIAASATDRGAAGKDTEYGAGVINVASALHGRGLGIARRSS